MSRLMIVDVPSYSCEFKGIREICELVRCAECKYCVNGQCWKADGLDKLDGNVADDDFCSRGERKESE